MAIFQITTGTSVTTNTNGDHAFDSDTPGADSLIVDAGAYLRANGADAFGALLDNTKAWKVQVNGEIHSQQSLGLGLDVYNTAASTITVGTNGKVHGGTDAIVALSGANISNAGHVTGGAKGVVLGGQAAHTVKNTGFIGGPSHSIYAAGMSADTVTNSGTLDGDVGLDAGNDRLTNTGTIDGNVALGDGDDQVTNSAVVKGYVDLGYGKGILKNTGTIEGAIYGGSENDTVTNSGTISGSLNLGDGANTVTNTSGIGGNINAYDGNDKISNTSVIGGNVNLGNGTNAVTNSGLIDGNVNGGDGRDTIKNLGRIDGTVDLGAGDDSFTSGDGVETVIDGAGNDTVKLGGGNDFYLAVGAFNHALDGNDTIDAGTGLDTYDAANATQSVYINLDKKAHDGTAISVVATMIASSTAMGIDVDGADGRKDKIANFEAAIGGASSDIIYGSDGFNELDGSGGDDFLFGYGGADSLLGGAGNDLVYGGTGQDSLNGGSGNDVFVFAAISDSVPAETQHDFIYDFENGHDAISLSLIDANTATPAVNDAFAFIGGQAFGGVAGQLRVYTTPYAHVAEGDVNGDSVADFAIEVLKNPYTAALTATDLML